MNKYPALTETVFYIMLSLSKPMHGYAIMQNIKAWTQERITMGAGTLYGALSALVEKGYITEAKSNDPSKRLYVRTELGTEVMKNEKTVFKAFVNHEKEETYLNNMNRQGWKLKSVRFAFYTFEKTESDKYKTVFHFAERQYQTTFVRTVTECGCEIAHQSNAGKYILFYINIPVDSENIDFLTDNQGKLDYKKRLNSIQKREFGALFAVFAISVLPALYTIPAIVKILSFAPEELYKIVREDPFGCVFFAIFVICGIVCGIMATYVFGLYCRTKRDIRDIASEMKIFE